MQTKRDQAQAHLFVMGRLASAMLRSEPDAPESPSGRTNRSMAISVIIALVLCAGAYVVGLLKPGGNTSWRTGEALIVSKETGTRYLYLDGRLRPVRNYASALLLAQSELKTTTVSDVSLKGEPHGAPIGIPGAPDTLPSPRDVDGSPWLVCSGLAVGSGGAVTTATVLAVGGPGDTGVSGARTLDGKESVLVEAQDKTAYLIWRGTRLRLDDKAEAVKALGYGSVTPRPVSTSFLNALPVGPDLSPPDVPGRGEPGPELGGRATRIGQVFRVEVPGATPRYHLLTKEGLVPLTATGAALVLGDPQTRAKAYGGGAATVADLGADGLTGRLAPASAAGREAGQKLPDTPPKAVDVAAGHLACGQVDGAASGPRTSSLVLPEDALGLPVQNPPRDVEPACLKADAVTVRPGKGALVRALGAGGNVLGDTTYLVTDSGVKYRLPTPEAVKALGYTQTQPQALPAPLLALLPTGPDLDAESASKGEGIVTTQCKTEK
ncbi:type VII secretion protein EccB [Streptomyces sp. NPDC002403]